jgi:hypothetical protein
MAEKGSCVGCVAGEWNGPVCGKIFYRYPRRRIRTSDRFLEARIHVLYNGFGYLLEGIIMS